MRQPRLEHVLENVKLESAAAYFRVAALSILQDACLDQVADDDAWQILHAAMQAVEQRKEVACTTQK